MVSAAAVWAIWGNDMFPAEPDPTGSKRTRELELQVDGKLTCKDPEDWTVEELRRWLRAVRLCSLFLLLRPYADYDIREVSCLAKDRLATNWSNG